MTNIPEGINTCNDEEDIISFTSSITFLIDSPKITENYVDDYLRSMEKRIKKHNDVDNSKEFNISTQKGYI